VRVARRRVATKKARSGAFALGSARGPRLKTKIEIILVPGCFAIRWIRRVVDNFDDFDAKHKKGAVAVTAIFVKPKSKSVGMRPGAAGRVD